MQTGAPKYMGAPVGVRDQSAPSISAAVDVRVVAGVEVAGVVEVVEVVGGVERVVGHGAAVEHGFLQEWLVSVLIYSNPLR